MKRPARTLGLLLGLAAWFVVFTRLHGLSGTDAVAATANASKLQSVERSLHLDIELPINQWLATHPAFITPSVWFYRLYYVALVVIIVGIALRHSAFWRQAVSVLVVMMALVLLIWWAVPMSPPRFALAGITDIVGNNDLFGSRASTTLNNGRNHFSAMPSMHTGFALWCAYAVWLVWRETRPIAARLAWLFPTVMVVVVIATGNHYVLDVVGSVLLLAVSVALATSDKLGKPFNRPINLRHR